MKFINRHKAELTILGIIYGFLVVATLLLLAKGMPMLMVPVIWIYPTVLMIAYWILQNKMDKSEDTRNSRLNDILASIKIVDSIPSNCGEPFDIEDILKTLEDNNIEVNYNFKGYITD